MAKDNRGGAALGIQTQHPGVTLTLSNNFVILKL